jgi:hypothetical protein
VQHCHIRGERACLANVHDVGRGRNDVAGCTRLQPAVPRARVERSRATRAVARWLSPPLPATLPPCTRRTHSSSRRQARWRLVEPGGRGGAANPPLAWTSSKPMARPRTAVEAGATATRPPWRDPPPPSRASRRSRAARLAVGLASHRSARRRVRGPRVCPALDAAHARPAGWKAQQQRARCYHLAPRSPEPAALRRRGHRATAQRVGPLLARLGPAAREALRRWPRGVCRGVGPRREAEEIHHEDPLHAEGAWQAGR